MTKQKQNKTAADEDNRTEDTWTLHTSTDNVPLRDLGVRIVLRKTRRRANLRKVIEVSAKGEKEPSPDVLATMINHLRAHYAGRDDLLDFIINALDPRTQSDWKLEFKRRKGKPTDVGDLNRFLEYLNSREAYEAQGMKQVHKRAVTGLATKYDLEFSAMNAAIRRGRKMAGR